MHCIKMPILKNLDKKCGLFKEFCKIKGIKENAEYEMIDYLDFCNSMSLRQIFEIEDKNNGNKENEL